MVADGGYAAVRCVVQIDRSSHKKLLSMPGGLTITGRHPVYWEGAWALPMELCSVVHDMGEVSNPAGVVFNFVLDRSHILLVNEVQCVTWGHGIKAPTVEHAYYGTSAVVADLQAMPGWSEGFVKVHGCFKDGDDQVVGLCAATAAA